MSVILGPKGPRGPPGPTGAQGPPGEPSSFITLAPDLAVVVSNNNGPAEIGKYINGFTDLATAVNNAAVNRILLYKPTNLGFSAAIGKPLIIEGMVDASIEITGLTINSGGNVILRNLRITIPDSSSVQILIPGTGSLTLEKCIIDSPGTLEFDPNSGGQLILDSCVITSRRFMIRAIDSGTATVKSCRIVQTESQPISIPQTSYSVDTGGRIFSFGNYLEYRQVVIPSAVTLFSYRTSAARMVSIGDVVRVIPTVISIAILNASSALMEEPTASVNQLTFITPSAASISSGVSTANTTSVIQNVTVYPQSLAPDMTIGQTLANSVISAPWKGSNIISTIDPTYNINSHDSTVISNNSDVVIPNDPALMIEGRELRVIFNGLLPVTLTSSGGSFVTTSGNTNTLPGTQGTRYYLKFRQGLWYVASVT